ncbi:hypothetical protein [Gemmobacter serpentinus]|uniref:hypothetical protein n=1 Tax=Gemmobacter serpentinus TaxID=2652247 RepID=UPI00124C0C73|nr:hypothetical protein [Gemmobacter serpentinus]
MPRLLAFHTILLPGDVVITRGQSFEATAQQAAQLIGLKAAREVKLSDLKIAKLPKALEIALDAGTPAFWNVRAGGVVAEATATPSIGIVAATAPTSTHKVQVGLFKDSQR